MMVMSQERRHSERIPLSAPLWVTGLEDKRLSEMCATVEVSHHGPCLRIGRPLA